MAAAYRSSSSNTTGSGTASSLSVTMPSGVQPNDALFVSVSVDGGAAATITPPSGWTQLRSTTGTNIRHSVYWRLADGYESTSYTWTFDSARAATIVAAAYSGGHPFQPPTLSSTVNNTANTTVTLASCVSTYSGTAVQFAAARNTTAASTMTPSVWTSRLDTCTTAGTFMETVLMDEVRALPTGGLAVNTATCTQSVASVNIVLFLDDLRPAFNTLAEDQYFVTGITSSVASSTFTNVQTNYANEVLLAFLSINKDSGATVSSVTSTGLTWVLVGRANTNAGSTELWRTFVPAPISAKSVTVTFSTNIVSANLAIIGIVGADFTGTNGSGAIGAFLTGSTTAAAPSLTVATTRNNSWVWFACNAPGATGNPTVGSGQTIVRSQSDTTNTAMAWLQRQNALTAASGTNVTMNDASPSSASCNMLAVEILPAVYHNMGATGVG